MTKNIWDYHKKDNWVVGITTNNVIKKDGSLVMGGGVALQARERCCGIDREWGLMVRMYGNVAHYSDQHGLISFPTKTHFKEPSKPHVIRRSAQTLVYWLKRNPDKKVVLPPPGCGLGRLTRSEVEPILEEELATVRDRVLILWN